MTSPNVGKLRRPLTEPEARAAYLAMGIERTVIGLWRHFDRHQDIVTPSQDTVWRWARNKKWTDLAKEHDDIVVAGAIEHLAADASVDLANRARLFIAVARAGTELALLGLQRLGQHLKGNPTEMLSPTALSALVTLSVNASTQAELLDGRPTDRDASSTLADFEKQHREILSELDRRLANGWGPPAGVTMQ